MTRPQGFRLLCVATFLVIAATQVDRAANWIDAHRVGLAIFGVVAFILFMCLGAYMIDALNDRPLRSRKVSSTRLPRVIDSLPRSESPVRTSRPQAEVADGARVPLPRRAARPGSPRSLSRWW